jgi:hypothetical protein
VSNSAGSISARIVLRGTIDAVGTKIQRTLPRWSTHADTVNVLTRISLQKLPSDQLIDFRFA